jgi:hypothetical protein
MTIGEAARDSARLLALEISCVPGGLKAVAPFVELQDLLLADHAAVGDELEQDP